MLTSLSSALRLGLWGILFAILAGVALEPRVLQLERIAASPRAVVEARKSGGSVEPAPNGKDGSVAVLSLFGTGSGDRDLEALASDSKLEKLDLSLTHVTDAGLVHLRRLPHLKSLHLFGTPITDSGLASLEGCDGLETLILDSTEVSDAGLAYLGRWNRLRTLGLSGLKVTDSGLAALGGLAELQALSLVGTEVTDRGLAHLTRLTRLKFLDLSLTRVTDDGIRTLQEALPELTIATSGLLPPLQAKAPAVSRRSGQAWSSARAN